MYQVSPLLPFAMCSSMMGGIDPDCTWANSKPCQKQTGMTTCKGGTIPHLHASGIVEIDNTTISGACYVKGQFSIKKSELHTTNLYGQGDIQATHISGRAEIYGNVSITGSLFEEQCHIWANKLKLSQCAMRSIHMHSDTGIAAIIDLGSSSTVAQDIIFYGAPGLVKIGQGSKIMGRVVNGAIQHAGKKGV